MIYFEESTHKYYNEAGEVYRSVSGIIDLYFPKFELHKDYWLYYKSLQDALGIVNDDYGKKQYGQLLRSFNFFKIKDKDINQLIEIKNILLGSDFIIDTEKKNNEWKDTNLKAVERGSKFHSSMENSFYENGHTNKEVGSVISHKQEVVPGKVKAFSLLNTEFGKLEKESYPELVVYNDKYKICGTMDNPIFEYPYVDIDDFKGFSLDTLIPTPNGFITMEAIQVGDKVFDGEGNVTKVKNISQIHYNKCYKLVMDDNSEFICDDEHRWEVSLLKEENTYNTFIRTTEQLVGNLNECYYIISPENKLNGTFKIQKIKEIVEVPTVPTKCIEVESENHTYLVGINYLKTHNTNSKLEFENKYEKAKYPIAHLDSCNGSKYKIQLSLYAWMLEQYGYKPRNLTISHIIFTDDKPTFKVEHKIEYLKEEVENLLEHYASSSIK